MNVLPFKNKHSLLASFPIKTNFNLTNRGHQNLKWIMFFKATLPKDIAIIPFDAVDVVQKMLQLLSIYCFQRDKIN